MSSERTRVVQALEATVGGTARHVFDLCEGLDRARFEVLALWSPVRDPDPERSVARLRAAGAQVALVPMARGPALSADLCALRAIRKALLRFSPHIVHCHSSKAGVLGRLAVSCCRRPPVTVYTPHAFAFLMDVPAAKRALYLAAERRLGRRTNRLIAVCPSEREVALAAGVIAPERCLVIHNGVCTPPHSPTDRRAKLAGLGLAPESLVILCVGDLRTQKGHRYAAQAMERVARRFPAAHLLIAGEGPQRAEVLRAAGGAADHVHLLGHRDDVDELLSCCDVFCQPSLWEGCPYAVLEAAAAAKAVVGSDIPGVSDIVQSGRCGWAVAAGDAGALAGALCEALGDAQERTIRGRAAAELVATRYTLAEMVARTAGLYEELRDAAQADG